MSICCLLIVYISTFELTFHRCRYATCWKWGQRSGADGYSDFAVTDRSAVWCFLTIHLPVDFRFRTCMACQTAVEEFLVNSPESVTHLPEALSLLLADGKILEEKTEVVCFFYGINMVCCVQLIKRCCWFNCFELLAASNMLNTLKNGIWLFRFKFTGFEMSESRFDVGYLWPSYGALTAGCKTVSNPSNHCAVCSSSAALLPCGCFIAIYSATCAVSSPWYRMYFHILPGLFKSGYSIVVKTEQL